MNTVRTVCGLRIFRRQPHGVAPCIRHKGGSSAPKLHELLEYWHKVKTGDTTPAITSNASAEYWRKVQDGTAKPYTPEARSDGRSWTIPNGVMFFVRTGFYEVHRYCDTVFDKNADNSGIDFKNRLLSCKTEMEFRKLEIDIAGAVSNYNLRDLVYFLDGFLVHDHKPKHLLSVVCNYMSFNFNEEEKTPSRVLHFLYIIGCSRNVPRELLGDIEKYISENIDEYVFADLTVIAFAHMVTNQPIVNYTILSAMVRVTLDYFRGRDHCKPMDFHRVANIYKSFALSKHHDLEFYTEMGEMLTRMVPNTDSKSFTMPQFMAIFRSYAAAGIRHDRLFKLLEAKVDINDIYQGLGRETGLTKSRGTRSKDINRLLWAFGSLGVPVNQVWIDTLIALLSEEDLAKQFPNSLVEGLVALTMFDVSPTNLYRKLYEPEVLRAVHSKIKHEKLDYYQLLLLHNYIKVMHPEFKQTNVLEKMFKDRRTFEQKLETSLRLKRGLLDYWHSLKGILGSECVTLKFLINVSSIVDIVIHLDENNVPIPIMNQYTEEGVELLDYFHEAMEERIIDGGEHSIISQVVRSYQASGQKYDWREHLQTLPEPYILPKNPPKKRKICIRMLGTNQCFKNHPGTLGYITVENRIISEMGYEILLISPRESHDLILLTPEEREQHIRKYAVERLNINTSTPKHSEKRIKSTPRREKSQMDLLDF